MKKTTLIMTALIFCNLAQARRGRPETQADYIVPTPPQYVAFSRFKVEIVDRFTGSETQKISYIFPEFLVGEANRVISFTRIPNTENSWTSPELDAQCAVIEDEFTCNIYGSNTLQGNKNSTSCNTSLLKNANPNEFSRERSLNHLPAMNLTEEERAGFAGVINSFFCQEPRGFLTYDIE